MRVDSSRQSFTNRAEYGLAANPAAYHRMSSKGRIPNIFIAWPTAWLFALPPLAVGICGDFVLVVHKLTETRNAALIAAGLMLSIFGVLWFGYPWFRRNRADHLIARPA